MIDRNVWSIRGLSTTASTSRCTQLHAKGGKGKGGGKKKEKNAYAKTIVLPQTTFNQRANAKVREPELQAYWKESDLYNKLSQQASSQNAERFVLHDGPPYANGDLHIGHALNKLLKDFINRKQILKGKQVHYVPGWDCHGLPIELKVLQTMKSKERQNLKPIDLRKRAAEFAKNTVQKQSLSFQRYGVIGDFDNPYLTLQPTFEAAQIGVFGDMFQKGHIFRGRKPVHWSPSSRTALAEAELEYPEGHVSKSIYVAFEVNEASEALKPYMEDLKVAIWTTTPWTMPANLAVAVNPQLSYSIVEHEQTGKLLVASDLVPTLEKKLLSSPSPSQEEKDESTPPPKSPSFSILATLQGEELLGTTYQHPLYKRTSPILAGGDYITTESGTGLVHTAPGHGQEDYQTGLKYGLDLLSPVNDVGKFTIDAGEQFEGLSVLGEGNTAIIDALDEKKALLLVEDYGHKYPYDWRTKKPTIFRATDQWFASVEGFRDDALDAIDEVQWVPDVGKNRIESFVKGRGDWCISRQRSWGVPIPVFYDKETLTKVLLNEDTLSHIQSLFAKHGSDAWWTMDEKDLLPEQYKDEAHMWQKGTDTMDVWFDSGSSWAGVAKSRDELAYPADIYLEGSDQHRGWFQSSLLTSVASQNKAPYKTVLTHGFVLDEKGYKMSKSLGNVIDPLSVIEGGNNQKVDPAYGADVLRLWVSSVDYANDVCIGKNIIKQTFESYRKLRNTARYMIGNLADFTMESQIPYDELPSLDKYMLGRLSSVLHEIDQATDAYQFNRATQELLRFSTADLSNFYLDVAKDRLYISAIDDYRRRSCQTVLHACIEGFAKAIAPILPHMAEDIWQNLPYSTTTESVFEGGWPTHLMDYEATDVPLWTLIRDLRDDVNKLLEAARTDKLVGASLEAAAVIYVQDEEKRKMLEALVGDDILITPPVKTNGVDELRTALMLSQVILMDTPEEVSTACDDTYVSSDTITGFTVGVKKAKGQKCGRCWFYDETVGTLTSSDSADAESDHHHYGNDLCQRCQHAIKAWEEHTGEKFQLDIPAPSSEEIQPVV